MRSRLNLRASSPEICPRACRTSTSFRQGSVTLCPAAPSAALANASRSAATSSVNRVVRLIALRNTSFPSTSNSIKSTRLNHEERGFPIESLCAW